ncbi:hypothetical protein [Methylorubrum zatmanii]
MKLTVRNGRFTDCGTVYSIDQSVDLDVRGDICKDVGIYVDRIESIEPPLVRSESANIKNPPTSVGWNRNFEIGWSSIFTKTKDKMPIHIEDNEFHNTGIIYRGPDQGEVTIKRNKGNGIGIVALTAPAGATFIDGQTAIDLPLPLDFTRDDIIQLIKLLRDARDAGLPPSDYVKSTGQWDKWLSRGANSATLIQSLIDNISKIFI